MVVLFGAIFWNAFQNLIREISKKCCQFFAETRLAFMAVDNAVNIAQNILSLFVRKGADLFYNLFFDDLHNAPQWSNITTIAIAKNTFTVLLAMDEKGLAQLGHWALLLFPLIVRLDLPDDFDHCSAPVERLGQFFARKSDNIPIARDAVKQNL